jgi:hypothetical protein
VAYARGGHVSWRQGTGREGEEEFVIIAAGDQKAQIGPLGPDDRLGQKRMGREKMGGEDPWDPWT